MSHNERLLIRWLAAAAFTFATAVLTEIAEMADIWNHPFSSSQRFVVRWFGISKSLNFFLDFI